MSSITSCGRSNRLPVRENMAFFKGFQNPRIPSYFSNTHLNPKGKALGQKNLNSKGILPIGWIDSRVGEETRIDRFPNIFNLNNMFGKITIRRFIADHCSFFNWDHLIDQFWPNLFDCCCQTGKDKDSKMDERDRYDECKPGQGIVPPTRNNDQCDSILVCKFLFQLISLLNFFQTLVRICCVFDVVMPFLSARKKKRSSIGTER